MTTRDPYAPRHGERNPFPGRGSRRPPAALRDPSGFLPATTELAWQSGNVGGPGIRSEQADEQRQVTEDPRGDKATMNRPPGPNAGQG